MKRIALLVSLLLCAIPALADQGVISNSGGSVSATGGLFVSTSNTVPAGTLNVGCPGASINACTGGSLIFLSADGLTAINGAFTSGSLVENCSGGGRGGHITCTYTFTGYFSGTATIKGNVQSILGVTYQSFGSTGANATGLTSWNSAYTPFYYSDTEQIVQSDDIMGTNQVTYGTQGSGAGQFYGAYGIGLDAQGRIYIADTYNCRLVRIDDMKGTNWTTFGGTCGSGAGLLSAPAGVAVDKAGHIYIADCGNRRIVRMDDMTGTNFVSYGSPGRGVGQFSPYVLSPALDSSGRIYVTDAGNSRVVRIDDMKGTNWTALTKGPVVNGVQPALKGPIVLALDSAGRIYIGENSLVVRVDDMNGTNWTTIVPGTGEAVGIGVDSGGTVFLAESGVKLINSMTTVLSSSGAIGPYGTAYIYSVMPIALPNLRPPAVTLSATALVFGNQNPGTTSAPQTVTITNFGGSPLSVSNITASAGFTSSSTCPGALVAGSSCAVSVSFAPSSSGLATGTVTIADNSGNLGGTQVVLLSGVAP